MACSGTCWIFLCSVRKVRTTERCWALASCWRWPFTLMFICRCVMLKSQPPNWLQAAQLLKLTSRQVFWRLSFPLVRPVIGMGAMLVAVEALNDYGTALAGTAYADNAFDRCWRVAR
ncbi:MAG: ABC transporter permease subunit [Symbiopectobacterium sp.]|uniref:ABC transporter permease subunit n=1 Tax=Symbiopectobacterium sp. TaxID=2952789 RepID=UPI003F3A0917